MHSTALPSHLLKARLYSAFYLEQVPIKTLVYFPLKIFQMRLVLAVSESAFLAFEAAFGFAAARFFRGSLEALGPAFLGLLATGVGSDETAGAGISTRSVLTLTSTTGLGFLRGSLLALTTVSTTGEASESAAGLAFPTFAGLAFGFAFPSQQIS